MKYINSFMKKILSPALFILLLVMISSCHTNITEEYLGWEPPELSKEEVQFREKGGVATVYCYNYPSWHIIAINGQYSTVSDNENGINQEANGEGIKVVVEDDNPQEEGTSVRILVDACRTHRSWQLMMGGMGDAYCTIQITQN